MALTAVVETAGASYCNIASATTTTVKSGAGVLERVVINKAVAGASVTIYDSTTGSGTKVGTITHPPVLLANQYTLDYGLMFQIGLVIVTSAADDITVVYR